MSVSDGAVDILIKWIPPLGDLHLKAVTAPRDREMKDISFLTSRFRGMQSILPDAASGYYAKILVYPDDVADPAYRIGHGASIISDRLKQIFEGRKITRTDFIPVHACRVGSEKAF